MHGGAFGCKLPHGEQVTLVVGLRELSVHALPDLLPGGATSLVKSEDGHLYHLEVGVPLDSGCARLALGSRSGFLG